LTIASARTSVPKPDEANLANPGYNLAYNGHVGTTLYHSRGTAMYRRSYYHLPAYFFLTAGWFRLAGFGLFQVRLFSWLFGLLGLVSWYWIIRQLSGPVAGLVSMGLVASDFFYEYSASNGRMDMMCCGLGAATLASYLILRDRSILQAIVVSHVLATLCCLTHPVGVLYYLCLVMLILVRDRQHLSIRLMAAAAVPMLIGGALLATYILQDLSSFSEQLGANYQGNVHAFRDPGLSSIPVIRSLQLELRHRYIAPFGLGPGVGKVQRLKAIVLAAYVTGLLGNLFFKGFRKRPSHVLIACMGLIAAFYLALVSPSKFAYYLAYVTAFLAAGFGMFLCSFGSTPREKWRIITAGVVVVAGLQIGGTLYQIRQDAYDRTYLPVIETIRKNTTPQSVIMGSGELWFGLEHDRYIVDDVNLGAIDGLVPKVFIIDDAYHEKYEDARTQGLPRFAWEKHLLETSREIYRNGNYQVYLH
jgi:4-amino-4-deoxy-L-arabinose transferase-like glycosyltransferase